MQLRDLVTMATKDSQDRSSSRENWYRYKPRQLIRAKSTDKCREERKIGLENQNYIKEKENNQNGGVAKEQWHYITLAWSNSTWAIKKNRLELNLIHPLLRNRCRVRMARKLIKGKAKTFDRPLVAATGVSNTLVLSVVKEKKGCCSLWFFPVFFLFFCSICFKLRPTFRSVLIL